MNTNKPRPLRPKPKPRTLNKKKDDQDGKDEFVLPENPPPLTDDIKIEIINGANHENTGEGAQPLSSVGAVSATDTNETESGAHPAYSPVKTLDKLTEESEEEYTVESKPTTSQSSPSSNNNLKDHLLSLKQEPPKKKEGFVQTFSKTFIPQVFFDTPPKKPYPPR